MWSCRQAARAFEWISVMERQELPEPRRRQSDRPIFMGNSFGGILHGCLRLLP